MADVHIEVIHSGNHHGAKDVAHVYNVDTGPLAIPHHLALGKNGEEHRPIERYSHQVDEYAVWLEDQVKAHNVEVMQELENIFQKACGHGVILITRCCPEPWITHAHALRRYIMELAGG